MSCLLKYLEVDQIVSWSGRSASALKTDLGVAGSSGKSASGFTAPIASERAFI